MDEHGQVLNVSSRAYGLETSYPGWVELEPERIWNALVAVLRGIAPSLKPGDALSIAGIGESFVLLDEQDRPTQRFITYLDQRCDGYLDNLRNCIPGEELYSITGLTLTQYTLFRGCFGFGTITSEFGRMLRRLFCFRVLQFSPDWYKACGLYNRLSNNVV